MNNPHVSTHSPVKPSGSSLVAVKARLRGLVSNADRTGWKNYWTTTLTDAEARVILAALDAGVTLPKENAQ